MNYLTAVSPKSFFIVTKDKFILEINGEFYLLRYRDIGVLRPDDKGLWRAIKVKQDQNGFWFCCDDDDYLIQDGKVLYREVGWELRKEML